MQLLICIFLLVSLHHPATHVNCSLPLVTSQGLLTADSAASFDSRRLSVQSNVQLTTPLTCLPKLNRIVYTQTAELQLDDETATAADPRSCLGLFVVGLTQARPINLLQVSADRQT